MTFKQMQIHKAKIFFWYVFICTLVAVALIVSWVDPHIGALFGYYGMFKAFQASDKFENDWYDGQFENVSSGSELNILDELRNTPVIKNNSDLLVNKLRGTKAIGTRPDLLILDDYDSFSPTHGSSDNNSNGNYGGSSDY